MASFVYNEFKRAVAAGEIDLDANTIKVRLVMNNTVCDTENDSIETLSDFSTGTSTCDSASYGGDKTLASKTVTKVDASDLAMFDAADVTWTALTVGTLPTQGALIYKYGTSDSDSVPIAFVDFDADVTHDGTDFTIQWAATGILQLT